MRGVLVSATFCGGVRGGGGAFVFDRHAGRTLPMQVILFWTLLCAARHHGAHFLPVPYFPPAMSIWRAAVNVVNFFNDCRHRTRLHDHARDQQ